MKVGLWFLPNHFFLQTVKKQKHPSQQPRNRQPQIKQPISDRCELMCLKVCQFSNQTSQRNQTTQKPQKEENSSKTRITHQVILIPFDRRRFSLFYLNRAPLYIRTFIHLV